MAYAPPTPRLRSVPPHDGQCASSLAAPAGIVTEQSSQRYSWAVGRLDDMYAGPKSPIAARARRSVATEGAFLVERVVGEKGEGTGQT